MTHCRKQQMNMILGRASRRLGRRQTEHASGIHKVEVISDRYLEEFESSGWWTGNERTASSSVQRAKAFSVLWKGTRTLKPLDKYRFLRPTSSDLLNQYLWKWGLETVKHPWVICRAKWSLNCSCRMSRGEWSRTGHSKQAGLRSRGTWKSRWATDSQEDSTEC